MIQQSENAELETNNKGKPEDAMSHSYNQSHVYR